ncbi:regulator of G-protein signaling 9-binding protein-like [Brienomyrus brachyistius]|uniref:regulator of G-protein signaling 9-binding protein-like n=1 Tax=Brienomyrus brachyistius TaxID=42636 RepID=UPI0020B24555|nr:regulator of G-protein signaling 9-binding protein-like [Brienomyrus brachyistius]
MGKDECKTLLDALNKVTACYRHLVITLGSSSDSQNLREELRRTRRKAQELAAANRCKLTALLKDRNISEEERSEYERLWVLFTSSMELLDADMRRSLDIGRDFPLMMPVRHLVQTGVSGSTSTVAARAMNVHNMKYEAESNIDTVDLKELQKEIIHVSQMIEEMEMKVQVAPWAVEAKQEAGAELKSTASMRKSSAGIISLCEEPACLSSEPGLHKILPGIVFTGILFIAGILAFCVIKLS